LSDPQANITGDPQGSIYSGNIGQVGDRHTNTGGGAYVEGDVSADTFIARDQINLIFQQERRLFAGVPGRPNHFLGRMDLVDRLVDRLCAGATTALSAEGLPGVGKTTLAVMLAHHRALLQHFQDGVLWAGLGRTPDLLSILAAWATALGIDITDLPTAQARSRAIANAIGQRRILIVIDDAWQPEPALLLRCGGPGCVHLLTTRHHDIGRSFADAANVVNVPVLDDDPAFRLLQVLAPKPAPPTPSPCARWRRQWAICPWRWRWWAATLPRRNGATFPS
jgi:hypothetical protein